MRNTSSLFPDGKPPSDRAELLRVYRAYIKVRDARILMMHRAGEDSIKVCRARTEVIDTVVRSLWTDLPPVLEVPLKGPPPISIIATGGYGRRMMNRYSDIDINFIAAGNKLDLSSDVVGFIGEFWMLLTDLKFHVGHGTDCVGGRLALAKEDNATLTTTIITRFLIGDPAPYAELQKRFVKECIDGNEDAFLHRQLSEVAERHNKHGNTPYLLHPHVKEGCGGLRDYQNLLWVAFAKLRVTDLKDLVGLGLLDKRSLGELERAHAFFLRVRDEMHYHEKRPHELLTMRLQGHIATRLGYKGKRMVERIEDFMGEYYRHAGNLLRQSSKLMDRFNIEVLEEGETRRGNRLFGLVRAAAEKLKPSSKGKGKEEHFDGFYSKHGRIFAESKDTFKDDPTRLMKLFLYTQQRRLRLAPDLFDTVCNTALVNREFMFSKMVREIFEAIISAKGDVARVLRQMHRVEFLGRYLPEFGALSYLVQHEFFHHYTADEHTLRCIDALDALAGEDIKGSLFYQQLFRDLQDPAMLYLALILHDTGRAANKKTHSDESTMLADRVARRLVIKGERRNLLLFLVNNHLLLFQVASKKDPEDPKTIQDFAAIVKTRENLDALMLLTMADSKGVGEGGWSSAKEAGMRELYYHTAKYFAAPADFMARASVPLDDLKAQVMKELGKGFAKEVEAHFEQMPRAYFNFRRHDIIASHIRQFRTFFEQVVSNDDHTALLPIMQWWDKPEQGYTALVVTSWDRHMLLGRISGALAAENINIQSAHFYRRGDNLVLDVFRVCTPDFAPVSSENIRKRVQKSIMESLKSEDFDFRARITKPRKLQPGMAEIQAAIPQWVYINNGVSTEHTVVELQAIDRIGLLYDIFTVIGKLGHSVTHARIATERGVAVDAIYLQDKAGKKITDEKVFMKLKTQIQETVLGG